MTRDSNEFTLEDCGRSTDREAIYCSIRALGGITTGKERGRGEIAEKIGLVWRTGSPHIRKLWKAARHLSKREMT